MNIHGTNACFPLIQLEHNLRNSVDHTGNQSRCKKKNNNNCQSVVLIGMCLGRIPGLGLWIENRHLIEPSYQWSDFLWSVSLPDDCLPQPIRRAFVFLWLRFDHPAVLSGVRLGPRTQWFPVAQRRSISMLVFWEATVDKFQKRCLAMRCLQSDMAEPPACILMEERCHFRTRDMNG